MERLATPSAQKAVPDADVGSTPAQKGAPDADVGGTLLACSLSVRMLSAAEHCRAYRDGYLLLVADWATP